MITQVEQDFRNRHSNLARIALRAKIKTLDEEIKEKMEAEKKKAEDETRKNESEKGKEKKDKKETLQTIKNLENDLENSEPEAFIDPYQAVPQSQKILFGHFPRDQEFPQTLDSLRINHFHEFYMPRDNDCGYHALGISRAQATTQLLENKDDEEIRKYVADEIWVALYSREISESKLLQSAMSKTNEGKALFEAFEHYQKKQDELDNLVVNIRNKLLNKGEKAQGFTGEQLLPLLNDPDSNSDKILLKNLLDEFTNIKKNIDALLMTKEVFCSYVRYYIGQPGNWMAFSPSIDGQQQYSSIDALAKINNLNINIWQETDEASLDPSSYDKKLKLLHCKSFGYSNKTIHFKYKNRHFSRLLNREDCTNKNVKLYPVLTAPFEFLHQKEKSEKEVLDTKDFPQTPKIIFETKKIRVNVNGQECDALQIHAYLESYGERQTIYNNQHVLNAEGEGRPPFSSGFDISLTKDGALQIGQLPNIYNVSFNLDNHDIRFFNDIRLQSSLEILSAKECLVMGNLNTRGCFKFNGEKFNLAKDRELKSLVFDCHTKGNAQSFVNKGLIDCEKYTSINTQLFDNRGGRISAQSATINVQKTGYNDGGVIVVNDGLDLFLHDSFFNSEGGLLSQHSNINIIEMNGNDKNFVNGNNGIVAAPEGKIFCKIKGIVNQQTGRFDSKTSEFETNSNGYGFINEGMVRTRAGCKFSGDLIHRGQIINETNVVEFVAKNLNLFGLVSSSSITTSELEYFDYADDVLYATQQCNLKFKHGKVLNHKISMPGALKIEMLSRVAALANHAIIQAGSVHILTSKQNINQATDYPFYNHGTIISTLGDVILEGKGFCGTLDGNGIHSARDATLNSKDINSPAPIHAERNVNIAATGNVYLANVIAGLDCAISGSVVTLIGLLKSGRDTKVAAERTITLRLNGNAHAGEKLELIGLNAVSVDGECSASVVFIKGEDLDIKKSIEAEKKASLEATRINIEGQGVVKAQDIVVKVEEPFEPFQVPLKASNSLECHLPNVPQFPRRVDCSLALHLGPTATVPIKFQQDMDVFGDFTLVAPHLPLYLEHIVKATRNMHLQLAGLDIQKGALVAGRDLQVECNGPIQAEKSAIAAGGTASLSGTNIKAEETTIRAQNLHLQAPQSVELFYCDIEIDGETVIVSPQVKRQEKPTPAELEAMLEAQKQAIEEAIAEAITAQKKAAKKKKRKIIIKSVIGVAIGAGLAAFLGPQMLALLKASAALSSTTLSFSTTTLAELMATIGQGTIFGATNAAITQQNIAKGAIEGGIFAGFGKLLEGVEFIRNISNVVAQEAVTGTATAAVSTAVHGGKVAENLGIGALSSALGSAIAPASKTPVTNVSEALAEAGRSGVRALGTAAATLAVSDKARENPYLTANLVASSLGATVGSMAGYVGNKLQNAMFAPSQEVHSGYAAGDDEMPLPKQKTKQTSRRKTSKLASRSVPRPEEPKSQPSTDLTSQIPDGEVSESPTHSTSQSLIEEARQLDRKIHGEHFAVIEDQNALAGAGLAGCLISTAKAAVGLAEIAGNAILGSSDFVAQISPELHQRARLANQQLVQGLATAVQNPKETGRAIVEGYKNTLKESARLHAKGDVLGAAMMQGEMVCDLFPTIGLGMTTVKQVGKFGKTLAKINKFKGSPQLTQATKLYTPSLDNFKAHHPSIPHSEAPHVKGQGGGIACATTAKRAGYERLDCRLPSDHGFDYVGLKKNSDGSVKELLIVESKYSHNGEFRLADTSTKGRQMSERWINKTIDQMLSSPDPAVRKTGQFLKDNPDKWKLRGNVLDPNGVNRWAKPTKIVEKLRQPDAQPRAPPSSKM